LITEYIGVKIKHKIKNKIINIFDFNKIGKDFGYYKVWNSNLGKYVKKTYDFDILAINFDRKEILIVECKWKDKVDCEKVLKDLIEKVKHLNMREYKIKFAIFSKSFKRKVEEYKNYEVICLDADNIEKVIKNS